MHDKLSRWLTDRCEEYNLSWSEASRRAGLSPNTISQIVGGITPGPKRLTALAGYFDVPPEMLFRMAGLLPPERGGDGLPPDLQAKADEILAIWERLMQIDPDSARRLAAIAVTQGHMVEAAVNANTQRAREDADSKLNTPSD